MMKTEEWQTFKDILLTVKGGIATDMFSRTFTSLDAEEKDVRQRTYYNIDQMLTFLSSPLKWVHKRSKWANLKTDLKGKVKPSQGGK